MQALARLSTASIDFLYNKCAKPLGKGIVFLAIKPLTWGGIALATFVITALNMQNHPAPHRKPAPQIQPVLDDQRKPAPQIQPVLDDQLFAQPKKLLKAIKKGMDLNSEAGPDIFTRFAQISGKEWDQVEYRKALEEALENPQAEALLGVMDLGNQLSTPLIVALHSDTFFQYLGDSPFDFMLRARKSIPETEKIYSQKPPISIAEEILNVSKDKMVNHPKLYTVTFERIQAVLSKSDEKPKAIYFTGLLSPCLNLVETLEKVFLGTTFSL